ncbi:MAG: insulinase family protein [Pseudomonadales bacterium]|nr:insulinase family protein [Pseudomonadales bacterium]
MKSQVIKILLPFCLFVLGGCTATTSSNGESVESPRLEGAVTEVIKSPNDDRDYRFLELDNKLKVLLISDSKADKSAAALTVFRGSYDDPVDRLGLAHFLEHMLFIGTEKYPEPDAYFKYVQSHGGSSNAYTATDHTNYFFDVKPDAFQEGLDRFAQFFISPLFSKEYVDREKNAVNSEYQLQIKQDGWRGFAVQKMVINPEHPASKFNIGTLETLDGDVHSALLKFFENNYSANQMALVVLAPESLNDIESYVVPMFSEIENRNLPTKRVTGEVIAAGTIPATLRHDNLKEDYRVSYSFLIPATRPHYEKKPVQYVANLIGHEGEGSLHKLLTEKGWITFLSAGDSQLDDGTSALVVTIRLTKQGIEHVPEISGYLFDYLELLQSSKVEEWLYGEQATVAEMGFRFSEKVPAIQTVQSLAPNLDDYPVQDILVAPFLMEEFDARLIRDYINRLRKDNVLVTVSKPGYEGSQTEPWFGVSYDLIPGAVEISEVDSRALHLPDRNPFLPESLELLDDNPAKPAIALKEPGLEIYLDTDMEFRVPRAVIHLGLRNDKGFSDIRDRANAYLYTLLVQDDLNALAYPAYLAGLNYKLVGPPKGFRVSTGGYDDKQLVLLEEVIARLVSLEINPDRFEVLKEELIRDLLNSKLERPFSQSYQRLQDDLLNTSWTAEEMLGPVSEVTLDALSAWRDDLLSKVSVQALMVGNVDASDIASLEKMLKNHLNLSEVAIAETKVMQLEGANSVLVDVEHDDASMVLYVQANDDTLDERARMTFLQHLVAPGYFATLRTEQQLGYVVAAANTTLRETGGMTFIVQSPVAGPDVLRDRTIEYMDSELERLRDMSLEEFFANKGGLINKLTQRDKGLGQRATRYWANLDRDITTFDARQQLAQSVSALTLPDMIEYLESVNAKLGNEYLMVFTEGKFSATSSAL